jgi:hypothetical protein
MSTEYSYSVRLPFSHLPHHETDEKAPAALQERPATLTEDAEASVGALGDVELGMEEERDVARQSGSSSSLPSLLRLSQRSLK